MNLIRPRSITKAVACETGPGLAGLHREHWDDSQDAKGFLRTVHIRPPERGFLLPEHGLLIKPEGVFSLISGGAFASGLYVDNMIDKFDATQLAIDLSLTTHKLALYTDTLTPNFSTDTAYSTTNELATATGYTQGGQTIDSPTVTESPAGTMMYDIADEVWAAPSSFTARGTIEYADALVGNNLIVAATFGADITCTAGTFTVAPAATGLFTVDWTP